MPLIDDLSRLAAFVHPDDLPALAELTRRLAGNRFRVLVVGEAKRGKSTLINALLGRQLLPVGVVPVTAVATTVTRDTPERLEVVFSDGRVERRTVEQLGAYVDEGHNPGNRLAVHRVTAYVDATVLQEGIELVDTPGTGSVHDHDEVTRQALATMDAALLVLTADPPMSASERTLLGEVAGLAVQTFVVVNKIDQLDPEDRPTVIDFVRGQVKGSWSRHRRSSAARRGRRCGSGWPTASLGPRTEGPQRSVAAPRRMASPISSRSCGTICWLNRPTDWRSP